MPYTVTSREFRVRPWTGITVEDLRREADGRVSFRVGPRHSHEAKGDGGPAIRDEIGPVDYPDSYAGWNLVSSIGGYLFFAGVLFFIFGIIYALFIRKEAAAGNPWGEGATTLEWTLPSPPPFHQYETLPRIADTHH